MSNIISSFNMLLCGIYAKLKAAKRSAEAMRLLSETNPTCQIKSIALTDVVIGEFVTILSGAILDKTSIKDCSYVSNNSIIRNVEIGKFCSISSGVQIGLFRHPSKVFVSTHPAFYSNDNSSSQISFSEDKIFDDAAPKTFIANDVWIGTNVIIPGGIHIGTGAIVAAGAVVVKDVPPYAVVGGNPAKIIRYRFSEAQIKVLLESEWWNWPIDRIRKCATDFSDIEKFVARSLMSDSRL